MLLLIDNYDSFVHNLARYFERLGQETVVVRNDAVDAERGARIATCRGGAFAGALHAARGRGVVGNRATAPRGVADSGRLSGTPGDCRSTRRVA